MNRGTNKSRRYWRQVRGNPKACPGGDCLCDLHEGVTAYRHSRVFRNRDLPDLGEEYDEYIDEVVWARTDRSGNQLPPWTHGDKRFYTSRLDYAYDEQSYCGDWCPCGSNLEYWMDFLRSEEVYPPPPLMNPVLKTYDDN